MPEERWEVYKKTKHRVGFRPPEGREFRLPRRLLPETFAVGETVRTSSESRPREAVLSVELEEAHTEVVQNPAGDDPERDRWLVWKRTSEWVGIKGAPLSADQVKTTGKHKVPPELVPEEAGPGDQILVLARVEDSTAQWLVSMD